MGTRGGIVVTRAPVKGKTPLSLVDHGGQQQRVMGFEPTTFTLATYGRWVLNYEISKSYGAAQITFHYSFPRATGSSSKGKKGRFRLNRAVRLGMIGLGLCQMGNLG